MLKNKSVLEVKIDEKKYQFFCDPDCQLGQLHDALAQMKQYIVQRIVDAQKSEPVKEPEVNLEEVAPS